MCNDELAKVFGQMAAYWPQVDDAMIEFFNELLGEHDSLSARQIFRSLVNPQIRIRTLKTLLQRSPVNEHKGPDYDAVIKEYSDLNDLRNDYLHGLWETFEDGRVYVSAIPPLDADFFLHKREVEAKEVEAVLSRMQALRATIMMRQYRRTPQP